MRTLQLTRQPGIVYHEKECANDDIQYFWELEVSSKDQAYVEYKIIPDGSIDIVFEVHEGSLYRPMISAPFTKINTIKLPTGSKYAGIRFFPGKSRQYVDVDLAQLSEEFTDFGSKEYRDVDQFLNSLRKNIRTSLYRFDNNIYKLLSSSLSQRQKRRLFKSSTGFTIREFNKIIKFQSAIKNRYMDQYFDQSHKIRSYKSLIDMTPTQLQRYL